jgi:hypothetical protein
MAWNKMTVAQLTTLTSGTLGAVTVGQLKGIMDLLESVKSPEDSTTLNNVLASLGGNQP